MFFFTLIICLGCGVRLLNREGLLIIFAALNHFTSSHKNGLYKMAENENINILINQVFYLHLS